MEIYEGADNEKRADNMPKPKIACAEAAFYLALGKSLLKARGDLILPHQKDDTERKQREYILYQQRFERGA